MKEYRFRVLMIYEPPEPRQGKYEEEKKKRKKSNEGGRGRLFKSVMSAKFFLALPPLLVF